MHLKEMSTCILTIAAFTFSSGCRNSCQQICLDMESFAEECGYQFTDEMKSECMQNQGKKTGEEKSACRDALPVLTTEWTCEDLEVYFDQSTISGEQE